MTDKWLIAGTGPTLHDPGPGYKICTLNRALCFFDHVDVAVIYHSLSLEAVERHLHKADLIVLPSPFDSLVDWVTRPEQFYEDPFNHPIVDRLMIQDWSHCRVMTRQINAPSVREFVQRSDCLPYGSSIVGALSFLVKEYDIRDVRTVGVDGGKATAPALDDAYSNRKEHKMKTYTKWVNLFLQTCARLEVDWVRVVNGQETKIQIKWSGEEAGERTPQEIIESSEKALMIGV